MSASNTRDALVQQPCSNAEESLTKVIVRHFYDLWSNDLRRIPSGVRRNRLGICN